MKLHRYVVLFCSLLAAGAATVSASDASACIGPGEMLEVDATLPADGAENVSLSPTLAVQLGGLRGYPGEGLFEEWLDAVPQLSLVGPDGAEIFSAEVELATPWDDAFERALVSVPVDGLAPGTEYVAQLQQRDVVHRWVFTTGDGEVEPFAAPESFEINLDAYFTDVPVTDCCPTEYVGECPTCFTIGYEPVPTINAGFDVLPHPEGAGAVVYTLQTRDDVPNALWSDVASEAFSEYGLGTLAQTNDRLGNRDICLRVMARSVVEPFFDYASNEICLQGTDHFSDPPEADIDYSRLECDAGDDPDDTDPPDDDGDDGPGDDDDIGGGDDSDEVPTDRDADDGAGWDLSEGASSTISDEGCGCATTGRRGFPAELLLLGLLGLRRRR